MIKRFDKKENLGITLIALVITIVVLIILAGVIISITLGNGGIIDRAKTAKEQYQNAQDYEQTEIAKYSNDINSYIDGDRSNLKGTVLYKLDNPTWQAVKTATCSENLSNYSTIRIDFIECWWDSSGVVTPCGNLLLEKEDFNNVFSFSHSSQNWSRHTNFKIVDGNKISFDSENGMCGSSTNTYQTANVYRVIGYK